MTHLPFYHETGSENGQAPIIFLHGLLGSKSNWRSVQKRLADKGYESYSLDLRNHGDAFHKSPHNYQTMAGDVVAFLEQKQLNKVKLLGHSMGGKVALWLALTKPELIDDLMIIDIAPVAYDHSHDDEFMAMLDVKLEDNETRGFVRDQLAKALGDMNMAAFLAQNYNPPKADEKASWRVPLDLLHQSQKELVGFPDIKTGQNIESPYIGKGLVIYGGKSAYVREAGKVAYQRYFPHLNLVEIKNAGHWPHIEATVEFMKELETHLEKGAK